MDVAMPPEEILFRWEDDFAEDFDFVDIQLESVQTILFTEHECNTITSYAKRREQIKKMFSILVDGRKNLNIFIDVLSDKYDWLADKLKKEDGSPEMDMYRKQVDTLRAELPKHLDLNVERSKYVSCFISLNYSLSNPIHFTTLFPLRAYALYKPIRKYFFPDLS